MTPLDHKTLTDLSSSLMRGTLMPFSKKSLIFFYRGKDFLFYVLKKIRWTKEACNSNKKLTETGTPEEKNVAPCNWPNEKSCKKTKYNYTWSLYTHQHKWLMLNVIMISCAHGQHEFSILLIEIIVISIKIR